MKLTLILFLFSFILCSTNDFGELLKDIKESIDDIDALNSPFQKGLKHYEKIKDLKEKEEYGEMLEEAKNFLITFYKENGKDVKKLKHLLKMFEEYGITKTNAIIDGYYRYSKLMESITKANLDKRTKEFYQINLLIQYIHLNPKMIMDNSLCSKLGVKYEDIMSYLYKYGEKLESLRNKKLNLENKIAFLKPFKYAFNFIEAGTRTYKKLNKCEKRDTKAYLVSTAQAGANVGTNIVLSNIGSFLGSFIPIPFVGTVAGGLLGSYM